MAVVRPVAAASRAIERLAGGQQLRARRDAGDIGRGRLAALPAARSAAESAPIASRSTARMAGERVCVWSSSRFIRFSIAQAKSANAVAPTTRPLPFSVWKERRAVTSASSCVGSSIPGRQGLADLVGLLARLFEEHGESARDPRIERLPAACGAARCHADLRDPAPRCRLPACRLAAPSADGVKPAAHRPQPARLSALSSMYQGSERPACSVSM